MAFNQESDNIRDSIFTPPYPRNKYMHTNLAGNLAFFLLGTKFSNRHVLDALEVLIIL
jgi:hypothetical protein